MNSTEKGFPVIPNPPSLDSYKPKRYKEIQKALDTIQKDPENPEQSNQQILQPQPAKPSPSPVKEFFKNAYAKINPWVNRSSMKKVAKIGKESSKLAFHYRGNRGADRSLSFFKWFTRGLDLLAPVEDAFYWASFYIRPLSPSRLEMKKIAKIYKKCVFAQVNVNADKKQLFQTNDYNRLRYNVEQTKKYTDQFDDVLEETFAEHNYWNRTDFLEAFNNILDKNNIVIDKQKFNEEIEKSWKKVYKPFPVTEVATSVAFTVFDSFLVFTVIQDIVPWARIAESCGKFGQVLIFIGTVPIKPFLSPIVSVALLFAIVNSVRRIDDARREGNKVEIWNASWDVFIQSTYLSIEVAQMVFPLSAPVVMAFELTGGCLGLTVMILKKTLVKYIKDSEVPAAA